MNSTLNLLCKTLLLMSLVCISPLDVFVTSTQAQAKSSKAKKCYRVMGGAIRGGILNESDYIVVNGTKVTGMTVEAGDSKKTLTSALNKIPTIQVKVVNGHLKLQSQRPISIKTVGYGGAIIGFSSSDNVQRKNLKGSCPKL